MRTLAVSWALLAATLGCGNARVEAPPPTLLEAIRRDSLPLVLSLLDAGAALTDTDSTGQLPLGAAVSLGRDTIVVELLAAGADPMRADAQGMTAWDVAMLDGTLPMVERLALHTVRLAGGGASAMQWFAGVRRSEASPPAWSEVLNGELLSLGLLYAALHDRADLIGTMRRGREIPNRSGYHALAVAARWGRHAAIRALLAIDVHPDVESVGAVRATPLYWASLAGDVEAARLLLRGGAEVDRAVAGGRRPLDAARMRGDSVLLQLLEGHRRR
jgi:ankyrin repeat protein